MNKPYVQSNYERIENDTYPTVDKRCITGLLDCVGIRGKIVDCCANEGSAIVDELVTRGYDAIGIYDAFGIIEGAEWVITNPPYKKKLVDEILNAQIQRVVRGDITGFATLMRNNFDFAKSRYDMFTSPFYYGQIHLMFRPVWFTENKASPIHNFVWHIWSNYDKDEPVVMYWKEDKSDGR